MKKVDVADATESLAEYARQNRTAPLLVTKGGRPIAALVPIKGADLESASLSLSPQFIEILQRSRQSIRAKGTISLEEMKKRLGLPESKPRKPKAAKPKRTPARASAR